MTKLTPAQARVIAEMQAGAWIARFGFGDSSRVVLCTPIPGAPGACHTRTIPSAMMGALARSGAIKLIGSPWSRDSKWVAADAPR